MIKALIRNILRPLGLQLTFIPTHPIAGGCLQFGPFRIETDNRELIKSYQYHPLTNTVIARVVAALAAKEPSLAMIDVGANCGDSLAIAKTAFDLPVLCIEPDEHLFGLLEANLHQFKDVTALQQYLGEHTGSEAFTVTKTGWNNTLVQAPDSSATSLTFKTLDEASETWAHRNKTRFLKCDTEGFDVRVLHGAKNLISATNTVILFEYNRDSMSGCGEEGLRVFSFLEQLGYGPVLFYDAYGRFLAASTLSQHELMRDLHDYIEGVLGAVLYFDVVAFSKKDELLARQFIEDERTFRQSHQH